MFTRIWRQFCILVMKVFYRHYEVAGLEHLQVDAPILLCANHANALADAVVLQAISTRLIHPMARSGLFKNPVLWPILKLIQAVPVYRRQDAGADTTKNHDSFARCYDLFDKKGVLLIFPEGQSHSDPSLRPLKTGAARVVLGASLDGRQVPLIVPVGLNFSDKGRFRSTVFIKFGAPVATEAFILGKEDNQVKGLTRAIYRGLDGVTLNVDSHEEMDFIKALERFFALRHGKYRQRSLELRFRALKKLAQAERRLTELYPEKMLEIKRRLQNFERMCRNWDIRDYHLTVKYRPTLVTRFVLRSLAIILLILPLGLWGILNSYAPFILTRWLATKVSKGVDQYDTAKMVIGLFLFVIFWTAQTVYVAGFFSEKVVLFYSLSLIPSASAAIMLRNERRRILENIRVFFLFIRKRKLRRYLEVRRHELEQELAHLVRLIKQSSRPD